jgi:hypothetical protein
LGAHRILANDVGEYRERVGVNTVPFYVAKTDVQQRDSERVHEDHDLAAEVSKSGQRRADMVGLRARATAPRTPA